MVSDVERLHVETAGQEGRRPSQKLLCSDIHQWNWLADQWSRFAQVPLTKWVTLARGETMSLIKDKKKDENDSLEAYTHLLPVTPMTRDHREQSVPEENVMSDILLPAVFTAVTLFCFLQICWMVAHSSQAALQKTPEPANISAFAG